MRLLRLSGYLAPPTAAPRREHPLRKFEFAKNNIQYSTPNPFKFHLQLPKTGDIINGLLVQAAEDLD